TETPAPEQPETEQPGNENQTPEQPEESTTETPNLEQSGQAINV
ncbi:hypothetical protein SAMN02745910_04718, partial [Priestia endophytica DSM 13796]